MYRNYYVNEEIWWLICAILVFFFVFSTKNNNNLRLFALVFTLRNNEITTKIREIRKNDALMRNISPCYLSPFRPQFIVFPPRNNNNRCLFVISGRSWINEKTKKCVFSSFRLRHEITINFVLLLFRGKKRRKFFSFHLRLCTKLSLFRGKSKRRNFSSFRYFAAQRRRQKDAILCLFLFSLRRLSARNNENTKFIVISWRRQFCIFSLFWLRNEITKRRRFSLFRGEKMINCGVGKR